MKKIVLIKLGALGDVIRTLPLARAIKKEDPESELTWITKKSVAPLLLHDPHIDTIKTLPFTSEESFDAIYNFDIDEEATTLAQQLNAAHKFGFTQEEGFVASYNLGAEPYLNTLFDDQIKKTNTKTYQELMFAAAEIDSDKEPYTLNLTSEEKKQAQELKTKHNLQNKTTIGIHIGGSLRWPSKSWHAENIKEFITLAKQKGYEIFLLAGPDEPEKQKKLLTELNNQGIHPIVNNPDNTIREFMTFMHVCDHIVCADSFALHLAVGLQKPTVALFFCTSPHEVEPYNLVEKIVAPRQLEFFPEKMDEYNEELTKSITAESVLKKIENRQQK